MSDTLISLELRGLDYALAGAAPRAAITVQRTNTRVRRVEGTATLGGPGGGSATVTFDLRTLPAGFDERTAGAIRVVDPAAGIDCVVEVELSEPRGRRVIDVTYPDDLDRPCIERQLVGVAPAAGTNAAGGTHRGRTADGQPFVLEWTVDDGGALPDTESLRGVAITAPPGFGSDGNVMVWALESFAGDLFAATCNWRLDGFRDWEKWAFSRGPIDTSEGTEIWRRSPDGSWTRVVGGGLGDPYNHGIRNMKVAGDHLYAITANHTNGFEIWRTRDGVDWAAVMTGGFGTTENTSGRGLTVFGDHLYVGTENKDTGAEIWRAPVAAAGSEAAWERVLGDDVTRSWYAELTPFDGHLYAGSLMTHTGGAEAAAEQAHPGCFIVRSRDGRDWEVVVNDSFGDKENLGILSMAVFRDRLYVGTTNGQGGEVHASVDGLRWERVFKAAGDPQREWHAWKLHAFADRLYLGLGRLERVWWSSFGLVSTSDGHTWIREAEPTMATHYGLRSMAEHDGRLYLGTASFPDCGVVLEARSKG